MFLVIAVFLGLGVLLTLFMFLVDFLEQVLRDRERRRGRKWP